MRKDVHEKCLVLYPDCVWNEQEDYMRKKLNRWNRQEQQIFREFVSDVELVTLDGNGRFLLSKKAQEQADIKQSVRFVGVGDTIEIWSADNDSALSKSENFSKVLEELLGNKED
jgi:MraZ protein